MVNKTTTAAIVLTIASWVGWLSGLLLSSMNTSLPKPPVVLPDMSAMSGMFGGMNGGLQKRESLSEPKSSQDQQPDWNLWHNVDVEKSRQTD